VSEPAGVYTIIWRYQVEPGQVAEFERRYGPSGDWSQLFSRAAGYRGTALLKDPNDPLVYLTIDRWETKAAYASFRERYGQPYRDLDSSSDALTRSETHVGSFTELA
jgi:hypothetical protein